MISTFYEGNKKKNIFLNKNKTVFKLKTNNFGILGDIDLLMKIDIANQNVDEIMEEEVFEEDLDALNFLKSEKK